MYNTFLNKHANLQQFVVCFCENPLEFVLTESSKKY